MGCDITAYGEVVLQRLLGDEEKNKIKTSHYHTWFESEFSTSNRNPDHALIRLTYDGKYWEDEIIEVLNVIANTAPIEKGIVEITGENRAHWRFIYENNEWKKQYGAVGFGQADFEKAPFTDRIYTHDEAAKIVGFFETVLDNAGIVVPSPEDDEKDPDNHACLYGSVYSYLTDNIEDILKDLLERSANFADIISDVYSGDY